VSIPVTITWNYSQEHRYESDLDEKVDALIKELCVAVPARHTGSAGGCWFTGELYPADSSHDFEVPNMECAERIREFIDILLKGYDPEYRAVLSTRIDD
jgi:hypothetical protein